ncbi:MAG: hypothetical protein GY869_11195, partial [Planctomycetes bacterium]|nr:hypothetical protein [Planctomycetota bacterium]
NPSQQFSNFFNSYAKSINKTYGRIGSLFQDRFKRIVVDNPVYFDRLIYYIHRNSQYHGFVDDFRDYPHSSYQAYISTKPSRVPRKTVMSMFDGKEGFITFHQDRVDIEPIRKYLGDDTF